MNQRWLLSGLGACILAVLAIWIGDRPASTAPTAARPGRQDAADNAIRQDHVTAEADEQAEPVVPVQQASTAHLPPPGPSPISLADIPDGPFKSSLETLDHDARQRVLRKLSENKQLLTDAASIRVDPDGMIYYVCTFDGTPDPDEAGGEEAPGESGAAAGGASVPVSAPPALHSRPGAPYVLFLDFNGHIVEGTAWNSSRGVEAWHCLPYDTDGDTNTFSTAELMIITQAWERVAEDFAPFDVDVTTEEPAAWGPHTGHALITPGVDANGVSCPHDGYGGIAYVDVFGSYRYSYDYAGNSYSPAWCKDYSADDVAEVISHELGHNLSLNHDGTVSNSYYAGHVNGSIAWGPIMGTGYGDDVSQWSMGEYLDANNTQDDLDLLADRLDYRSDDHGNSIAAADAMSTNAAGILLADGVAETTGDPDLFTFTVGSGAIEIYAAPYRASSDTWGGNLDIKLSLYNGSGVLLTTSNPALETKASIMTNLAAGTYYLCVEPTGTGDPLSDPPTGYTLYGSLGQYALSIVPPGGLIVSGNVEGFETGSYGLWHQVEDDDIDWSSRSGSTPSSSTGPSAASVGNVYLYTEASSPNNPGKVAKLESVRLNFGTVVPGLIFDYHMYGNNMGTLAVDVYDGSWNNDVWSMTGQQQPSETNAWSTASIDLSAFAGKQDVVLRLRGTTGGGYTSDMAIDNILLSYDIDLDGLPDTWEFQYFGNATGAVAEVDDDNDGFNNLAECISGHNPTNPASRFRITSLTAAESNGTPYVVNWDSVPGRIYGVLWSDSMPHSFTNISGDLPYPASSYTDSVERAGPVQFYRIEVRTNP